MTGDARRDVISMALKESRMVLATVSYDRALQLCVYCAEELGDNAVSLKRGGTKKMHKECRKEYEYWLDQWNYAKGETR